MHLASSSREVILGVGDNYKLSQLHIAESNLSILLLQASYIIRIHFQEIIKCPPNLSAGWRERKSAAEVDERSEEATASD